jgi:DNA binding protein with HTH domain
MTWGTAMASDLPYADQGEADQSLRPVWEDTPDETDADRRPPSLSRRAADGADVDLLLATLADAADALARLDARVAASDETLRVGLLARLALAEAAGWLAHAQSWVHPLDLALRAAGLTAPAALAALGAGARALPQTLAQPAAGRGWEDPPLDALPAADQAIADAVAFARVLCRLPGGGPHPFASFAATADTLAGLGARIDRDTLGVWWSAHAPAPPVRRRYGARRDAGSVPRPPLLAGALAAQTWMQAAITDPPEPALALLASFGRLARSPPVRHVFVPFWSAYPAVGFSDRAALPTLRSEAADRIAGWGVSIAWPAAGLHLIAESARMGLRDLDRLQAAADKGRGDLAGVDRRSRLPAALEALLRAPLVTPKELAAKLRIAPQTATALLREMQGRGVAREVTGRGRFRAFAV